MALPARVRYVMNGLIEGVQSWSTSLWFSNFTTDPTQDQLNLYNEYLTAAIQTQMSTIASAIWSPGISADYSTCYYYDAAATTASLVSTPEQIAITGGTSSIHLPPQCSVVMSLRSGVPGRSGRGRNYLPLGKATAVGANGQLATGVTNTLADAYAAMIGDLNAVLDWNSSVKTACINSVTRATVYDILSVVVDSVVDTQRRRTDQLTPSSEDTTIVS